MDSIVLPLSVFEVSYRKKLMYLTLNPWIQINRSKYGTALGSRYKREVEAKIKPYVIEAMQRGVTLPSPAEFSFNWVLRDQRIDLDNLSFMQKFILDAFQASFYNDDVFIRNDNLKGVVGLLHRFTGVDKSDPCVIITWESKK